MSRWYNDDDNENKWYLINCHLERVYVYKHYNIDPPSENKTKVYPYLIRLKSKGDYFQSAKVGEVNDFVNATTLLRDKKLDRILK